MQTEKKMRYETKDNIIYVFPYDKFRQELFAFQKLENIKIC